MKKRLEKYWWLELPCFYCTMSIADALLRTADMP
jgi:hypothetical protein